MWFVSGFEICKSFNVNTLKFYPSSGLVKFIPPKRPPFLLSRRITILLKCAMLASSGWAWQPSSQRSVIFDITCSESKSFNVIRWMIAVPLSTRLSAQEAGRGGWPIAKSSGRERGAASICRPSCVLILEGFVKGYSTFFRPTNSPSPHASRLSAQHWDTHPFCPTVSFPASSGITKLRPL